jgi:hypothetical protein
VSGIKLKGSATGTGNLDISAPSTSTNRTLNLPDLDGTLLTADGDGSALTGIVHPDEVIKSATAPTNPSNGDFWYDTVNKMMKFYSDGWGTFGIHPIMDSISPTTFDGTSGSTFVISGMNFETGSTVHFITNGGTEYIASTVVYNNSTQITASTGRIFTVAEEPLDVKVTNPNGMISTKLNIIDCGGLPSWNTASGSLGTWYEADSVSSTVVATDPEGSAVSYSVSSGSLPSGLSVAASTGIITGTAPAVGADTTSNFDIAAADPSNNISTRSFSMLVKNDTAFDRDPWGIGSVWGFYKFEGNGNDTGGSNHISAQSGLTYGSSNQKSTAFGECGQFASGNTSWGTLNSRGSGSFSASVWFRCTNSQDAYFLGDQGGAYKWSFGPKIKNSTKLGLWNDNNGGYPTNGFDISVPGGVNLADGTWHHAAFVNSGGTGYIYYNGSLLGSGPAGSWSNNPPNPMRIGAANSTGGGAFTGQMDNVRVYSKALSSSEISTIYNAEAPR